MENYVFRVLNGEDQKNIELGNGICSKIAKDPEQPLKELFQLINVYLQKGSQYPFPFISCSVSFPTIVERYNTARCNTETPRTNIAVITDHFDNVLLTTNGVNLFDRGLGLIQKHQRVVWNAQVKDTKKVVYNLAIREKAKQLGYAGLILKKDGSPCENNVTSLGNAAKSKEVLVFHHIPGDNIAGVLDPFQIDLLYACHRVPAFFNTLLHRFLEGKTDAYANGPALSPGEQVLFFELYHQRRHLEEIVYEVWEQFPHVDILALFWTFREMKRRLLTKQMNTIFPTLSHLSVVEDTITAVRIGYHPLREEMITFGKEAIHVPVLPLQDTIEGSENANDVTLVVACPSDTEAREDNTYWLSGNGIIRRNEEKKELRKLQNYQKNKPVEKKSYHL